MLPPRSFEQALMILLYERRMNRWGWHDENDLFAGLCNNEM